jgi:hypothetical protein
MDKYSIEVCNSGCGKCPLNVERMDDFRDLVRELSTESRKVDLEIITCHNRCSMGNSVTVVFGDESYTNFNSIPQPGIDTTAFGEDPVDTIRQVILKQEV